MIKKIWTKLFLEERPSISLSLFRLAVAWTVGSHVLPSFVHLDETYFQTAFKTHNTNFFTLNVLELVPKSPDWLIVVFVWIFCLSWISFFVGFKSRLSCVVMVLSCYYFYALNSFHVGTLSWDILLVTLFLMCITNYHGDYFSVDCLLKGDADAYKRKRPYFIQRLLQFQIGFTFFYTALYKSTAQGNWLKENPLFYVMSYPPSGTTKWFLGRDFLIAHPDLCFWIGISIVIIEYLMIFLLFYQRTRLSAVYLGFIFHVVLILTLDVPATFFFLFPWQLCLFFNPQNIVRWIEHKRIANQSNVQRQSLLVYDGNCQFCVSSVNRIKTLDLFATLKFVDFHKESNLVLLHKDLTKKKAMSQLYLIEPTGNLVGGFFVFRRICFTMPMLFPSIFIFYLPGMGFLGSLVYRVIAKNRYFLHRNSSCNNNLCFKA